MIYFIGVVTGSLFGFCVAALIMANKVRRGNFHVTEVLEQIDECRLSVEDKTHWAYKQGWNDALDVAYAKFYLVARREVGAE